MIDLYIMGVIYFVLGIVHFTHPNFYKPMMPKFLPAHLPLIYWSGVTEIILGLGVLFPITRALSLWGIIFMLIVFLIVHVNMLFPKNRLGIPIWLIILRIPVQFILMYWAYVNLN
tara:strand:+ start:188 stop:532 length:345 start_codon:yes stop_codon:yes gene_type:complete